MRQRLIQAAEVALGRQRAPQFEQGDHMAPYLRSANIVDGELNLADVKTMNFSPVEQSYYSLRDGDVLVTEGSGSRETVGTSAVWRANTPGTVCFQNTLLRVRPREGRSDGRYLAWWLRHAHSSGLIAKETRGANIQHIGAESLRGLEIDLPDLAAQRRIADFLDDQVSRIDEAVRLREEQITALSRQQSDRVAELFANERFVKVPLRRVIERWIDYRGATPVKTVSGVPLLTAKNIRNGQVTFESSQEFIAEDDYVLWMRRGLPRLDDVLLTTEAPLGEVAQIVDPSVALAQRVILLRPDGNRMDSRWLYWFLRSPQGRFELWSRATGTTAPGIKAERLREVLIPCPSLAEQRAAVSQADAAERVVREAIPLMREQVELLRHRKRSLITAAVSGEWDMSMATGRELVAG